MGRAIRRLAAALGLLAVAATTAPAADTPPKSGGTFRIYHRDSPASPSILEEATISTNVPFMAVFNNLVLFRQDVRQNSFDSIAPELATGWAWNDDKTRLTFKLRSGVTWHDGKPFSARDVKCTFDLLMDKTEAKLRKNPRRSWYSNVTDVAVGGDDEVTFVLGRPQPSLLELLASGYAPIYPCHVSPRDMRTHPIGTGPFKFVEFKANESIKLVRNAAYWRPGRPYLDAIEYTIVPSRSTAILAFVAGTFDMTFPTEVTIPLLADLKRQAPNAVCDVQPTNVSTNLIVNRDTPPFDNPDLRRAMALAIDRRAFIDILAQGQGDMGGAMLPPPEGVWGLPANLARTMPGFGPDVGQSRAEARAIMQKLGYGPDKRLAFKVATRNIAAYRDPAVILIDQLKSIYMDGELDTVETSNWQAKVTRKDYTVGLNLTGNSVDDPDQAFYENYACGSERNYTGYCNKELQALFDKQSAETDMAARRQLVWDIQQRIETDVARPVILYPKAATCWQPAVKGFLMMQNSIYNGYRFEDVWLDR